jgi:hypothetical protein
MNIGIISVFFASGAGSLMLEAECIKRTEKLGRLFLYANS